MVYHRIVLETELGLAGITLEILVLSVNVLAGLAGRVQAILERSVNGQVLLEAEFEVAISGISIAVKH